MVAETAVNPDSLVYPMFVVEGENVKEDIPSMPNQYRFSIDEILKELESCVALGVKSILLFGIPSYKDEMASSAYDDDGIVQRAVRSIKAKFPELYVITDVCLCEYMSHGHCGIVKEDGDVDNDPTLELLAKTALSHAEAGADMVAPSDMMDGRVAAIREKYPRVPIMASGGKTPETIRATIEAGANAIVYTPPSSGELLRELMDRYREEL